ncbi:MAG TPA: bifunctional glutamate N-acetyltransferase/amino-acid acetyltransferase ArgJ [bacterium]|nr:bifunctional glutamate N-acetyltransferase/amino-acid acetyltransferase ArgJ [bacterium]
MPGFSFLGMSIGIKDGTPDFAVAASDRPCAAAGVFTRNNFPGAPVLVGREHLKSGRLQAVVVNSKNANVATGERGVEDARRVCRAVGAALRIDPTLVLPSSTGVIGVPLPVEKLEQACSRVPAQLASDRAALERFARAIMTTDTRPKAVSVRCGGASLTGIAKGAGMIEPHMATMLAYFFTDAQVEPVALQAALGEAVERSFNRISVDTDTSTSDTAVILANGKAGPVPARALQDALGEAATYLAKEIARDGEGASKLIELRVEQAPNPQAALAIAKSIINSPLVKTAIYGADPNWGRLVMAIGKVFDHPVPLEGLRISFGTGKEALTISAAGQSPEVLGRISAYLKAPEVCLCVSLGAGTCAETVWGCDLTEGYIRENAYYTS